MKRPKVSFVITNYNKGRLIQRAIRSCLNQILIREYAEVIVVDDGSTDDSIEIIAEFVPDVILIPLADNQGVAHASNVGLQASSGEFWMRVDADDYLSAHSCAFMGLVLEANPEFGFVYSDHIRVDRLGRRSEVVRLSSKAMLFEHGAGVLFRTQLLRDFGGYDANLRNAEDYDLLARLTRAGVDGFRIPVPLYRYYIEGENLSQSSDRDSAIAEVRRRYGI